MVYDTIGATPHSWAGMTAEGVRATAEREGSLLIVPVGSVEQHGRHLPVATDTILVDAVATLAAERVGDSVPVLVTPPIWTGNSPHHLPFGGTITIDHDTLLRTLEDVADAALENGFDALVLLNGHGGNASLVRSATTAIGRDQPDVEVLGLTYFELAARFIDEIRESDVGGMAHAGEFETSLMLHLRPDLVREDAIEGTPMDEPYEWGTRDLLAGGPLATYRPFTEYTESGAIGEPGLASAEKGAEIYRRLGDELERLLAQVHERNRGD